MKHLDRLICFTAVQLIVAGFSILETGGARAELRPVFDELKLFNSAATMPTIEVEAEGKDWVAVSTEILHVTTNYYVSLKRGDIITISARYADSAITKSRHPGGGKRRWGEFAFEIPKSQMGVLTHFAIDACNQKKKSGARTDEVQTAFVQLPFKLFVRAERFSNQSSKTVDGSVQAKVVCKKAPKQLEISHLDVKVDDTGSCPKTAVVNVGFQTNRGDRINFTLEHMNRGLQTSQHFAQPYKIDGQYVATKRIEGLAVDSNTEFIQVRLEDGSVRRWNPRAPGERPITCPRSFKVTSVWLSYDVEKKPTCPKRVSETVKLKATAPGEAPFEIRTRTGLVSYSGTAVFRLEGAGYAAEVQRPNLSLNAFETEMMAVIKTQSDANSGWVPLKVTCLEVLSGSLDLRGSAAGRCEGEAALSIHTNLAGKVPYRLDCTGDRSWTGIAQSRRTGPDTFIAVDTVRFDVRHDEEVKCALKARAPLSERVLALKGRTYDCRKPSRGAAGSTDLRPETGPDPRGTGRPTRVTIEPQSHGSAGSSTTIDRKPRVSCTGGVLRNRTCVCPRRHKAVRIGKSAWRCVRSAIIDLPKKGNRGSAASSAPAAGARKTNGEAQADRRRVKTLKTMPQANRKAGNARGSAR